MLNYSIDPNWYVLCVRMNKWVPCRLLAFWLGNPKSISNIGPGDKLILNQLISCFSKIKFSGGKKLDFCHQFIPSFCLVQSDVGDLRTAIFSFSTCAFCNFYFYLFWLWSQFPEETIEKEKFLKIFSVICVLIFFKKKKRGGGVA